MDLPAVTYQPTERHLVEVVAGDVANLRTFEERGRSNLSPNILTACRQNRLCSRSNCAPARDRRAAIRERKIFGDGAYIHRPDLDEDLTVAGLLAGWQSGESPQMARLSKGEARIKGAV